jgi:hypothetical protein
MVIPIRRGGRREGYRPCGLREQGEPAGRCRLRSVSTTQRFMLSEFKPTAGKFGDLLNPLRTSVAFHKYGVAPRGPMRRIRQGVATEAYCASTVRERNAAGADAAALECNRIYETQH